MSQSDQSGEQGSLIDHLLKDRKQAKSKRTRETAATCERELAELKRGSPFERLVAWYFEEICSGYGYVVRTESGLRSRNAWITPAILMSHLGGCEEPVYLAIRPPSRTNWAVFDIDEGSRYHPASPEGEGIERVMDALRTIGLKSGIEFQSSTNGGMHIWFPLSGAVRTWELAIAIQQTLETNNVEMKNGVLEVRPNRKSYGTQYLAIRAPLTGEGNGIFIEDFGFSYELSVLKKKWTDAKCTNKLLHKTTSAYTSTSSSNRRAYKNKTGALARAQERVLQGFTGRGQTQGLKLACLQVARLTEGIDNEEELRSRVLELIIQAPGFDSFCGHKKDIESGRLLTSQELRKALTLIPGGYKNTWKEEANKNRTKDAKSRAVAAVKIALLEKRRFASLMEAFRYLKSKGAPARSWWYKQENSPLLAALKEMIDNR